MSEAVVSTQRAEQPSANPPSSATKPAAAMDMELLFLQVIGMLAVVMGHYSGISTVFSSIFPYYSWHMPFFMLISGMLFARKRSESGFWGFTVRKVRRLLLPALFVHLCYGVVNALMLDKGLVLFGGEITLESLFVAPFTTNYRFYNDLSLWFIFQLFIIEMLANVVYLSKKAFTVRWSAVILLASLAVSLCASYFAKAQTPTNDGILLLLRTGFLFFFFVLGITYEKHWRKWVEQIKLPLVWCGVIALMQALYLLFSGNGITYNTHQMRMTDTAYFFLPQITTVTATAFLILLARGLRPVIQNSRLLRFVGPNLRYVVYHHQIFGILLGCLALYLYSKGYYELTEAFSVEGFQNGSLYCFAWGTNPEVGYLPYLLIPFFAPILVAKLANLPKNKYLRFAIWVLLFAALLALIVCFGNYCEAEYVFETL